MSEQLVLTPSPVVVGGNLRYDASGFDPRRKVQIALDGVGWTTNTLRPAKDGTFHASVTVSGTPRTQIVTARYSGSTTVVASTAVSVVAAPVIVPPVGVPDAPVGELAALLAAAGPTVTIPAKHYHEHATIDVAKPITINFAGDVSSDGTLGTLIRFRGPGIVANGLTAIGASTAVGAIQQGYVEVSAPGAQLLDISIDGGPYAGLRIWDSANVVVRVREIKNAPVLGIVGWNCPDGKILSGGTVHDCNMARRGDPGWEAGGIKIGSSLRFDIGAVESHHSFGRGAWFDAYCSGAGFTGTRTHHNAHNGLMVEIQDGYYLRNVVSYEDAWWIATGKWGPFTGTPDFLGWAGGVLVSSCGNGEVTGAISAWNPVPIAMVGQYRIANETGLPTPPIGTNGYRNSVHDNLVTANRAGKPVWAWSDDARVPMDLQTSATGNAYGTNNLTVTGADPRLVAAGVPSAGEAH